MANRILSIFIFLIISTIHLVSSGMEIKEYSSSKTFTRTILNVTQKRPRGLQGYLIETKQIRLKVSYQLITRDLIQNKSDWNCEDVFATFDPSFRGHQINQCYLDIKLLGSGVNQKLGQNKYLSDYCKENKFFMDLQAGQSYDHATLPDILPNQAYSIMTSYVETNRERIINIASLNYCTKESIPLMAPRADLGAYYYKPGFGRRPNEVEIYWQLVPEIFMGSDVNYYSVQCNDRYYSMRENMTSIKITTGYAIIKAERLDCRINLYNRIGEAESSSLVTIPNHFEFMEKHWNVFDFYAFLIRKYEYKLKWTRFDELSAKEEKEGNYTLYWCERMGFNDSDLCNHITEMIEVNGSEHTVFIKNISIKKLKFGISFKSKSGHLLTGIRWADCILSQRQQLQLLEQQLLRVPTDDGFKLKLWSNKIETNHTILALDYYLKDPCHSIMNLYSHFQVTYCSVLFEHPCPILANYYEEPNLDWTMNCQTVIKSIPLIETIYLDNLNGSTWYRIKIVASSISNNSTLESNFILAKTITDPVLLQACGMDARHSWISLLIAFHAGVWVLIMMLIYVPRSRN